MLIVNASKPKGPEIAMQRHLKEMAGVLIGNGKIPRDGREPREVDGIVLTPSRVFVVEAKGFVGKTANSGTLVAPLNGDWTIGGQVAQFYGGEWPNVQARQSSQALAGVLREKTSVRAFVTGIASISAKDATMPDGPVLLGDVMVCKDHDLLDAIAAMPLLGRNKPLTVDHVFEVLVMMGLPEAMWPERASVEREWDKAASSVPLAWQNPAPGTFVASTEAESDQNHETFDEVRDRIFARKQAEREAAAAQAAAQTQSAIRQHYLDLEAAEAQQAEQAKADRARNRTLALLCLAILGGWLGWVALTGADDSGTSDVERAQEVFASAVVSEFPDATIKRDTMACRRANTANPVEDEDFFCDATIKRAGKTVKVTGRLPANLESAQVDLADAEDRKG